MAKSYSSTPGLGRSPHSPARVEGEPSAPAPRRKPGRPPSAPGTTVTISVPVTHLRALRVACLGITENPRSQQAIEDLRAIIKWTEDKLGPLVNEEYVPRAARLTAAYVVTLPDGVALTYDNIRDAADAYGVGASSLAVMLSRGQGYCSRTVRLGKQEYSISCEKVASTKPPLMR